MRARDVLRPLAPSPAPSDGSGRPGGAKGAGEDGRPSSAGIVVSVPALPAPFARHTHSPPAQQFVEVVVRIGLAEGAEDARDDALAFSSTSPDTVTVKTSYADDEKHYRCGAACVRASV